MSTVTQVTSEDAYEEWRDAEKNYIWRPSYDGKECPTFESPKWLSWRDVVLHCLLHTPAVLNLLEDMLTNNSHIFNRHKCSIPEKCGLRKLWQLASIYWGLGTSKPMKSNIKHQLTAFWKAQVEEQMNWSDWDFTDQNDAMEYVERFLKSLNRHLEDTVTFPDQRFNPQQVRVNFDQLFTTDIYNLLTCHKCTSYPVCKEPVSENVQTVEAVMPQDAEILEPEKGVELFYGNQVAGGPCQEEECDEQTSLGTLVLPPSVLFVRNKSGAPVQVHNSFIFPASHSLPHTEPHTYELRSIILHVKDNQNTADETNKGHYQVIVRNPNGLWRFIDGERASDAQSFFCKSHWENVYALVYQEITVIPAKVQLQVELDTDTHTVLKGHMNVKLHLETSIRPNNMTLRFEHDGIIYDTTNALQLNPKRTDGNESSDQSRKRPRTEQPTTRFQAWLG